jgi:hypothetical protein
MSGGNELINFYELDAVKALQPKSHNPHFKTHGIKVPFRMITVGSSGSGKTNITMNLLSLMANTFNKVILYTRNKHEPLYEYLQLSIPDETMLEIHEGLEHLNGVDLDTEYEGQTLILFDDLCNEKNQSRISELFIRGRKLGVSLVYLTQKYSQVPTLVREQASHLILKKISGKRDITTILRQYSLGDLETIELLKIYKYCIDTNILNFLFIDLEAESDKTFRKNFDEVLNIDYFRN